MNMFPQIKKNIIVFFRNGKIAIITFLVFPMIMAYIYGTMQADLFSGKNTFKPIAVEFKYDTTSNEGVILASVLKDDNVKKFIISDFKEEPKCTVTVSKDFKNIDIKKLKSSDTEVDIVEGFMKNLSENINQYKTISDNVNKLSLNPEQKGILINKLIMKIQQNNKLSSIEVRTVPGYRSLSAREYYTISMFSYTSMMLIMILVRFFYKDRKMGVIKRSFSTPNTKISFLTGYLVSSFMSAFTINFIYVVINRIFKIAFMQNISSNILLILFQSILQAAVIVTIISYIDSEQMANSFMMILIFIPVMFGGVFFNVDFMGIKFLKVASNFAPNSLILNAYKNLSITGGILGAGNQMIVSAGLSVVLIAVSMLKVKSGWEE